jgi:hypothetical protein
MFIFVIQSIHGMALCRILMPQATRKCRVLSHPPKVVGCRSDPFIRSSMGQFGNSNWPITRDDLDRGKRRVEHLLRCPNIAVGSRGMWTHQNPVLSIYICESSACCHFLTLNALSPTFGRAVSRQSPTSGDAAAVHPSGPQNCITVKERGICNSQTLPGFPHPI